MEINEYVRKINTLVFENAIYKLILDEEMKVFFSKSFIKDIKIPLEGIFNGNIFMNYIKNKEKQYNIKFKWYEDSQNNAYVLEKER